MSPVKSWRSMADAKGAAKVKKLRRRMVKDGKMRVYWRNVLFLAVEVIEIIFRGKWTSSYTSSFTEAVKYSHLHHTSKITLYIRALI